MWGRGVNDENDESDEQEVSARTGLRPKGCSYSSIRVGPTCENLNIVWIGVRGRSKTSHTCYMAVCVRAVCGVRAEKRNIQHAIHRVEKR